MKIQGYTFECNLQFSAPDVEGWMNVLVDVKDATFSGCFRCTVEIEEFKFFSEI